MGLLILASLLKEGGCGVEFVDCMDRQDALTAAHPGVTPGSSRPFGVGRYPKMRIPKPEPYASIPRRYYRHGIHPESFHERLKDMERPDLIWVTSVMTYWYPGVAETIDILHAVFPETPIWLGGIYAKLCPEHARRTMRHAEVVTDPDHLLPARLAAATGFELNNRADWGRMDRLPPPALELVPHLVHAPVLTSLGCPFRCPYCASAKLQPRWETRCPDTVFEEIARWHRERSISDFAFFDDALLLRPERSIIPLLERVGREGLKVRFHTPNAVHVSQLTPELCRLLRQSGFQTLRLGLETASPEKQKAWGGKVETETFFAAMENLTAAGFPRDEIGVYLLCGLPGQSPEEVADAIEVVRKTGARPRLCEYSPVPGTAMWNEACTISKFPLAAEPLTHNNSFFACRRDDFTYEDLLRLKDMVRR
jgi:radical SAM superfamily enzyme YgiQ (UPF0313 family)